MESKRHVQADDPVLVSQWPWKHLIGFVLCIALTAFSLTGLLYSSYHPKFLLVIVTGLSFTQAMIQLYKLQPKPQL